MTPKEADFKREHELFRLELTNMVDHRHALVKLAHQINWQAFVTEFGPLYTEGKGRPGIAIQLMVGLHYLKHAFNLSDEAVVERWIENPYWQYFCGEQYFNHSLPIDPSQMTRFRKRIGTTGCETMLKMTIQAGLSSKTITPRSLQAVNVDTTVQDKAVAFPTDARLYHKARAALVRQAKRNGLALRQSYERLSKRDLMMNGRYAHARQMQRARRMQKRLRTYLGCVIRDIERKIVDQPQYTERFAKLLTIAKHIHAQQRQDNDKLYSVHAPETECIAKGKAHKKYEFGVKVSIASTSADNFVVGMQALPGRPYDGHTLKQAIEQVAALTGILPKEAYVDRGYKGHKLGVLSVWIAGAKRGVTAAIKKKLKRRNAVEPVIGHMKSDGRLGRNFLKGTEGDAMNALLCGAGHNLRKILRRLALFWLRILSAWMRSFNLRNRIRTVF
ncbi:MAG: IS5 family transposase [Burkholderiales bacterium]